MCLFEKMTLFQHTAARRRLLSEVAASTLSLLVSTHSRAEAAARADFAKSVTLAVSTHSRAEAAAIVEKLQANSPTKFQHTAARRRLQTRSRSMFTQLKVSTHSRAEAAARSLLDQF